MTNTIELPATWMRGGTSKGLFLLDEHLPADPVARNTVLLRALGSPDPYKAQIDGLGGATSSTSKVVVLKKSTRPDYDVDYWFGQVSVDEPLIDTSGNCGNLSAAVGPFAIHAGLVSAREGVTPVRIWQQNIGKRITAHVPTRSGTVIEAGVFAEDGVAFAGAEILLEFHDPADAAGGPFPTGQFVDTLQIEGYGAVQATLIVAGNPTVFVRAQDVGLTGTELPAQMAQQVEKLALLEHIRAAGAVAMRLAKDAQDATRNRPATPKIAWVAPPLAYVATSGKQVEAGEVDCVARILSMGKPHHAFTGTGAIALAVAAACPGTLVHTASARRAQGATRFGHAAGAMTVGADIRITSAGIAVETVRVTRTARRLMQGTVFVPAS
jgi:probable AcnD-accessory protein PrpF